MKKNTLSTNCMGMITVVLKNINHLRIKENLILDYDVYYLTFEDLIKNTLRIMLIVVLICIAFYKSIVLFFVLIPLCIIYPFTIKDKLKEDRKKKLLYEFKDILSIVKSFLDANYSIENAFKLSLNELIMLNGEKTMMVFELKEIIKKMQMNKPIEIAFKEFASKTKIEDIEDFAEVFTLTKQLGGDMIDVIKNTVQIINDKIEIEKDIDLLTHEKQFEQSIMNLLPFLIIIYLNVSSSDYLNVLYTTLWGRIFMTIMLMLYFVSINMSKKILDIEV